jgi:hypothetical protein
MHRSLLKKVCSHRRQADALIDAYNRHVSRLETLNKPEYKIPTPIKLGKDIIAMRDDGTLQQDVWIEPCEAQPPRWFSDENVRKAIRGLHKIDRCWEEMERVICEADNMLNWFYRELVTVEVAIHDVSSA